MASELLCAPSAPHPVSSTGGHSPSGVGGRVVDIGIAGDVIVLVTVTGPDPAVFVTVTPIGA